LRIGYSDVEAVISARHGAGSKPTALLGRLKYLQRFDWPPGGARGQGSRAGYGLEQLLALMMAFELLELGLPPVRIVRLLRTGWDRTLPTLVVGWASALHGARPMFLSLAPRALEELGLTEDDARPSPDRLVPIGPAKLDAWRADFRTGPPAIYVLDPRALVWAARMELHGLGIVPVQVVDDAFMELGVAMFGVDEPSIWSIDGVDPD
jgi:hypothetical protein